MREPKISALILAKNEAETLPACLASLGWVNEVIVVVDAASRDITERIARRRADRVLVRPFTDFASQRNAALALASGDWVFAIDADERAPAELAAEIRATLATPQRAYTGYHVPIRSIILGKPFNFSGTQDDKPLRPFRRWPAANGLARSTTTVKLGGDARHYRCGMPFDIEPFPICTPFSARLTATRPSWCAAGNATRRAAKPDFLLPIFTIRPLWTFAKLYLGKRGFRDGLEGLAFCALSGMSVAVCKWKMRELLRAESTPLENVHLGHSALLTPRGFNRRGGSRHDLRAGGTIRLGSIRCARIAVQARAGGRR